MRNVNRKLRQLSGVFVHAEPVAFFCECQDATCYAAIWMSLAAFDATVASQAGWLFFRGHQPRTTRAERVSAALKFSPDESGSDPFRRGMASIATRLPFATAVASTERSWST